MRKSWSSSRSLKPIGAGTAVALNRTTILAANAPTTINTMTRSQAQSLLPIIQAFAEGKEVQFMVNGIWTNVTAEDVAFTPDLGWRVKPKPFEIELWVNEKREYYLANGAATDSEWEQQGFVKIRLQEVID